MNSTTKTIVFWVVMLVTALLLWQVVKTGDSSKERELSFTEFMGSVERGEIADVTVYGNNEVRGKFKKENLRMKTVIPNDYPDVINTYRAVFNFKCYPI